MDALSLLQMIRGLFVRVANEVTAFIQRPTQVLLVCLSILFAGLLLDGSLFRLWRMHRDSADLIRRTEQLKKDSLAIDHNIRMAKDPTFIELKAREKFDLASEGDLIFVFSDEN